MSKLVKNKDRTARLKLAKEGVRVAMDNRRKYKIGDSVREAIYQLGGVKRVARHSPFPASTLYKYLNGSYEILNRKAHMLAGALKLKPIFSNGVFDVEIDDKQAPQLIRANYCFNCGNKLKESTNE